MSSLFQRLLAGMLQREYIRKGRQPGKHEHIAELQRRQIDAKHFLINCAFIAAGVLVAAFGLKGFLMPSSFIDGGITGISLIISNVSSISVSLLILILNIPFMLLALSTVGRQFAVKSIIAITLLAIAVHFIPYPVVTHDKLLVAAFGGFFLGLGIGLAIRGGAVLDGTEVMAVYLNKKFSLTVGTVILIFNVFIFLSAAYILSVETALYAILTYFAASKTVDFIVDGIEEYIGVSIITDKPEEVRLAIIENLGRGCTLYMAKNGFAPRGELLKDTEVVYTVITRLELSKLKNEIDKIDIKAFVIMNPIFDAKGGMVKKKPLRKLRQQGKREEEITKNGR
ncbi:MAG TPA: YitT family protein [Bacteroidales bacterium]|nr:YitT family protein [Bacteroidales bacterium]